MSNGQQTVWPIHLKHLSDFLIHWHLIRFNFCSFLTVSDHNISMNLLSSCWQSSVSSLWRSLWSSTSLLHQKKSLYIHIKNSAFDFQVKDFWVLNVLESKEKCHPCHADPGFTVCFCPIRCINEAATVCKEVFCIFLSQCDPRGCKSWVHLEDPPFSLWICALVDEPSYLPLYMPCPALVVECQRGKIIISRSVIYDWDVHRILFPRCAQNSLITE